jgi:glutamine synthetase
VVDTKLKVALKDQPAILKQVASGSSEKVKVAITDIDGVLRGKTINREKFASSLEKGFGFCSVVFGWDSQDKSYDHVDCTGWHNGYPDYEVRLDPATLRSIPWESNTPFLLGDFPDLEVCPRQLLKKIIARSKGAGYAPMAAAEFEWFNFIETPQSAKDKNYTGLQPLTPGMFGYSLLRPALNQPFFDALTDELRDFQVPLEGLHTETGPGVLEAAIQVSDALEAADRAVLFKTAVKQIGYRFGILPTFMARPSTDLPGCSGHIHQSLWDLEGKTNLFYADSGMPDVFRHYLAGQQRCLAEILPMFAPTVNSYKRLVEGFWAPTSATWGIDNRTTAFRVIPGGEKGARVETRVSGADINPYLAIAASVASGLYGIENKLEPLTEPVAGNGYKDTTAPKLPSTLIAATERMANSEIAAELFGETFVKHFTTTREWEWQQAQEAVTDWELKRYFEII